VIFTARRTELKCRGTWRHILWRRVRYFRWKCCLHLQGSTVRAFYLEGGGFIFHRKLATSLPNYRHNCPNTGRAVRSQSSPCGMCPGQGCTGTEFRPYFSCAVSVISSVLHTHCFFCDRRYAVLTVDSVVRL